MWCNQVRPGEKEEREEKSQFVLKLRRKWGGRWMSERGGGATRRWKRCKRRRWRGRRVFIYVMQPGRAEGGDAIWSGHIGQCRALYHHHWFRLFLFCLFILLLVFVCLVRSYWTMSRQYVYHHHQFRVFVWLLDPALSRHTFSNLNFVVIILTPIIACSSVWSSIRTNSQFRQIHFAIQTNTFGQIHFTIKAILTSSTGAPPINLLQD